MISKNDLKGKMVQFIDKNGATRICKVYKITGKTLTVGTVIQIKKQRYHLHWERIHPDKNTIFGAYIRNKVVEIKWNGSRTIQGQKISEQNTPQTENAE
jgi:hypothetical protein